MIAPADNAETNRARIKTSVTFDADQKGCVTLKPDDSERFAGGQRGGSAAPSAVPEVGY